MPADHALIEAHTIDKISDEELCKKTGLKMKAIREHSYASLLYKGLRCSYLHEYRAGDCILHPDNDETPLPSLVMYNGKGDIFFSLHHCSESIKRIAENLANNAPPDTPDAEYAVLQYPKPLTLWCDG
jgi:hypothetical protein